MRLTIALLFTVLVGVSCNSFQKIQKNKDPEFRLKKADEFFAKKKYRFAQQLYEELFTSYKGTAKFEDLYYKYAYSFYYLKSYRDAENLFKGYLEVFPTSSRAEEIDYMRAYSYYMQSPRLELDQSNTHKAMMMMQTFINTHPGSPRNVEAATIIDEARKKLEAKEARSAQLFYDLGHFRAAGIAYDNLMNNFPESTNGEEYKLQVIRSYYKFAQMSIESRRAERFGRVVSEVEDYQDRFPDGNLMKEALNFKSLSLNHIKALQNEQTSSSAKL